METTLPDRAAPRPSLPAAALPASAALRAKIGACAYNTSLRHLGTAVGTPHYQDYLCLLHQIVRASIPLMELARSRCDLADPLEARLAQYFTGHIREEGGHADILLADLELAGLDAAQVLARTPAPALAEMVGAQYYWILHHSPLALLGYIAFLEGTPPSPGAIAYWATATGLPPAAFHSLRLHGDADPLHRRELDDFIDSLALDAAGTALVGLSAMQAARLAGDAWLAMTRQWRRAR
ncbi:iron-containing redox enzyme family protein [Rugamonas rubra]|uniref:Iron-containing redox enzyme n=1 Tax=Rugamonas rubra TaxID=758825 RepID=A0A1I4THD3_9BURK|nr:iron-containing redox enzyme family protein [Rugamonas rubra]SFM76124.1 hypothetical protein SAMN02982985_05214 [Rugamonas rubra]